MDTSEKLYSVLSEQSVLGSIILDPKVINDIDLQAKDFFKEVHQIIFEAMKELYKNNKEIDIISVIEQLRKTGDLEKVGGIGYITSLSTIVPTTSNIKYYADTVKELAEKRKIIKNAYKLISDLESGESINYSLDKFERLIDTKESVTEGNSLKDIMQSIFNNLESGKKIEKVNTGLKIIDKHTNGFARGELISIGAKSGIGKSALALKMTKSFYEQNKKVLIISREMTKEQIAERIILSETRISKNKYENRNFSSDDWVKLVNVLENFTTENIIIDDKSGTIFDIQRQVKRYKPDILIVDYVQLLTPTNDKESRERQVADLSRQLKNMTIDLDMIVIQLTQIAEKGTGNYRPHGESYTRESRTIYHDSNIVIYLHEVTEETEIEIARKRTVFEERGSIEDMKETLEKYKETGTKFIEVIVDKNRNGTVGSNYMWFKGDELEYYPVI